MLVIETLNVHILPEREPPVIKLTGLPKLSTILHDVYVHTPVGLVK